MRRMALRAWTGVLGRQGAHGGSMATSTAPNTRGSGVAMRVATPSRRRGLILTRSTTSKTGTRGPGSSKSRLVHVPREPELPQDRGGDLLDRFAGRVAAADAFPAHQLLGLVDLEAAVLQVGVAAVGPALLADFSQPLGRDGQAVELRLLAAQRFG